MRSAVITVLLAISTSISAQSPDWVWANRAGGSGSDDAYATATDADGNVFVTGYFTSTSVTFGSTTLTNAAYEDIFLVKYNSAGSVQWARAVTGPGYDEGMGVTTDADGNVIIVGFFTSPSLTFGSTTITNTGGYDGFIAKYDPTGSVLWAHNFGGDQLEHFYGVATDGEGDVYVTGDFASASILFGLDTLTNLLYPDAMVLKYSADGTERWAHRFASDLGDQGTCVATDQVGHVVVGGYFHGAELEVSPGTSILNEGSSDGFVIECDTSGTIPWARHIGGTGSDYVTGIAVDGDNNIALTGTFDSETLHLSSSTLENPTGLEALFIAKYDNATVIQWAVTAGGSRNHGTGIACDPNGDIVVSGYFDSDLLTFGAIEFDLPDNVLDIFVVKCSADGNYLWATIAGSDGQDQAVGVATDGDGSVFITGWFSGTDITFGSTTLTNDPGGDDLFVAKLNGSVGIVEDAARSNLALFPNPANNLYTLRLLKGSATAIVTVNDLQGRMVMPSVRVFAERATLDVSTLPPGIYEVVVTADGIKRTGRLIIAR